MNTGETNGASQYLTFTLGDENFALEINNVREILDVTTITKVPKMPAFMRGVINLRGHVVPVIDLRLKLGMSATEQAVDTRIVIVETRMDGELMQIGALADSVLEVIDLDSQRILPPPRLGTQLNAEFIQGIGKHHDDRFLIILNIDKVFTSHELATVQTAGDRTSKSAEMRDVEASLSGPALDKGDVSSERADLL